MKPIKNYFNILKNFHTMWTKYHFILSILIKVALLVEKNYELPEYSLLAIS